MQADPRALESHFAFGENWRDFLSTVNEDSIAEAVRNLESLLPGLSGGSFLDIGCGSGLAMLAALRLGAREVVGIDIDPNSVAAAQALLTRHAPGGPWSLHTASILDNPKLGVFDVVHSWGVLHHTGAMWNAVHAALERVAPNGRIAIALYHKTRLCRLWQTEKRLYTQSGPWTQAAIRAVYKTIYVLGLLATFRNPVRYIREYKASRGMNFHHNVHDWLGGYPYESASPAEVEDALSAGSFTLTQSRTRAPMLSGILGTGCDEFVAKRTG